MIGLALIYSAFVPWPELIVKNAKIWSDGHILEADCLVVSGGKFTYIGQFRPNLVAPSAKVVDAKGRYVLPGMIDCHTHLLETGTDLFQLQLRSAKSKGDFLERIRDWAARQPAGKWIIGSGWSAESWPGQPQPTKAWLDAVTGDHPTVLTRMDGHSAVVNSLALKKMGVTRDFPKKNPKGGVVDRDPVTHDPTGVFRDDALIYVELAQPHYSKEETFDGLRAAIDEANRWGVTTVCDISSANSWDTYMRYEAMPHPTMRFALYARTGKWSNDIKAVKNFKGLRNWVEPKGLKAFMDGSLGSRTAFMARPFIHGKPGDPNWRGVEKPGATNGIYANGFKEAARNNLQVIVHSIGDQANHDLLNLFEQNVQDLRGRRFRVEHAQHLLRSDIPRFGRLGVIASMQPYHKFDDGRYCDQLIGRDRSKSSYAFGAILKSGGRVAFGSDWDVVTINPWLGVGTAVTGKIATGKVWMPEGNISVSDALKAYTSGAAYAAFWEKKLGRIRVGNLADFVILNRSPFTKNVDWKALHPVATYVGGWPAYYESSK